MKTGWQRMRLKVAAPPRVERLDTKPTDAAYVALEHIESWSGRLQDSEPTENPLGGVGRFRAGDVLFGKLRPYLAKVARPDFDGVCSTELVVLRPRRILPQFLQYQLLSPGVISQVNSWTFGTKMPRVDPARLLDTQIWVPPIDEQRAIAEFLDDQTASIDSLIRRKQRLKELLDEEFDAFVTGTIWGSGYGREWPVAPLMRLTDPRRPIMYGIVLPGHNVSDGIPLVKGGDVSNDRLRVEELNRVAPEIEASYARARLRAGDVVLTIRGRYADAALVPNELTGANITQDIARLAPRTEVDSRWILYALRSAPIQQTIRSEALGAAVKGVNIRDVRRYRVPLPPLEEQVRLVREMQRNELFMNEAQHRLTGAVSRLREYTAALITAAVTGQIDVGEAA